MLAVLRFPLPLDDIVCGPDSDADSDPDSDESDVAEGVGEGEAHGSQSNRSGLPVPADLS